MQNNKENVLAKLLKKQLDKKDLNDLKACIIAISIGTTLCGGSIICDMNGVINNSNDNTTQIVNNENEIEDNIKPDYKNEEYYAYALVK